jgi:hypothetical protein
LRTRGRLERLRAVVETFAYEVAAYPNAARLVLVEAFDAGPAALARTKRTRRPVERVMSWSLREDRDALAPSPLIIKGIVADGARVARARRLDGCRTERALLAGELSDLCCFAVTSPSRSPDGHRLGHAVAHLEGASRDTNRSLQSNGVEPNVIGHGRLRHTRGARGSNQLVTDLTERPVPSALTMSTRRGIGNHE